MVMDERAEIESMTTPGQPLTIVDPDNIPETLVTGPFNIQITGPLAVMTFTHLRNDPNDVFSRKNPPRAEAIVRARLVIPLEGLLEIRKLIEGMVAKNKDAPGTAAPV
jgi:hypothetical protein